MCAGRWCFSIVILGSACTYPSWLLHPPWLLRQIKGEQREMSDLPHTISFWSFSRWGKEGLYPTHPLLCVLSPSFAPQKPLCCRSCWPGSWLQARGGDKQWNVLLNRKLCSVHSSSSPSRRHFVFISKQLKCACLSVNLHHPNCSVFPQIKVLCDSNYVFICCGKT